MQSVTSLTLILPALKASLKEAVHQARVRAALQGMLNIISASHAELVNLSLKKQRDVPTIIESFIFVTDLGDEVSR